MGLKLQGSNGSIMFFGPSLPEGGNPRDILIKNSEEFGDAVWYTLPPEMHRVIFRGKYLGDHLTDEQKEAIQSGTFKDLYVGDYWIINGITWRIVDIDYWLHCGFTAFFETHHVVIMPDTNLGENRQMNATNITTGGYVGSLMYTSNMNDAKTLCTNAFGKNILAHDEWFTTSVANGKPSAGMWYSSTIDLPNICMILGHPAFSSTSDGETIPYVYAIDKTQLALFSISTKFIVSNESYWLRDVVSTTKFAVIDNYGLMYHASSNDSRVGIRPVFPVGVAD